MSQKDILREGVIEQTPAASDNRSSFAGHIVGEGHTRCEVVVIGIVEIRRAAISHLHGRPAVRWIKPVEEVVLLFHNSEVIPAQAKIESQARRQPVTVLQINTVTVFRSMPLSVPGDLGATIRNAFEERFQWSQ